MDSTIFGFQGFLEFSNGELSCELHWQVIVHLSALLKTFLWPGAKLITLFI